jgi:hypothetical protein
MAKPILVINYCIAGLSQSIAVRNLRDLQNVIGESSANDEYYVFLLPVKEDSNIQVFYEKDFAETSYDELKKLIEDKFNSFSNLKVEEFSNECEELGFEAEEEEESKLTKFGRKIGILPK